MTILEQILAGLQQKFAGVDTAILTRIATKKAEGVTDETKVNSIIEGISFSDVLNSYGDFRAGDASKTAVTNYEKRHNLKDGKPIETTTTTKTEENSLFMEIGKKSLSPLKLTLTLRAKDGMGREWKLAWVKANED